MAAVAAARGAGDVEGPQPFLLPSEDALLESM